MHAEDPPPSSELPVDVTLLDDSAVDGSSAPRSSGEHSEDFGRYRPLAELGRGGTARVVQAHDPELNRTVAVKVLLDERATPTSRARLLAEAKVIAQLEHPAIVPIHDIGQTEEDGLYYVMKEIRGDSLRHLLTALREGDAKLAEQWDRPALLRAFVRVCEAVEYAHARGVLHRDIKPSNIVFGDFGAVYLVDWGLARVMGKPEIEAESGTEAHAEVSAAVRPRELPETHDSHETQHGAVLGTPGYISPEQLSQRSSELDGRSDVWSLGAILYELLTLERYIIGDKVAGLLHATLAAGPLDVERLASARGLPRFLAETCGAALAPDRDARLVSAKQLGDRLQSYLESVRRREEDVASWIGGHIATAAAQIEARVLRIQDEMDRLVWTTRMFASEHPPQASVAAWAEAHGLRYVEELQRTISETACVDARENQDSAHASWYSHLRQDDPNSPDVARMSRFSRFLPLMDKARERHGVSFVYYIDASGFLCGRPCVDMGVPESPMPVGYDNRTYTAYLVAAPAQNPERSVQLTPPHIDFAEFGLIMAFAQPVYEGEVFKGVWAMDVPLAALYQGTDIAAGPDQTPFIVDRQGFIVVHPVLEAYAQEAAGTEFRHEWGRIDLRLAALELEELFAAGSGWLRLEDADGDREEGEGTLLCYQAVPSVNWLVCTLVRGSAQLK